MENNLDMVLGKCAVNDL